MSVSARSHHEFSPPSWCPQASRRWPRWRHCFWAALAADRGKIVVEVDKPGARIHPLLFGLMTEEINHSYDGTLRS
jgi:hypothetical protein